MVQRYHAHSRREASHDPLKNTLAETDIHAPEKSGALFFWNLGLVWNDFGMTLERIFSLYINYLLITIPIFQYLEKKL